MFCDLNGEKYKTGTHQAHVLAISLTYCLWQINPSFQIPLISLIIRWQFRTRWSSAIFFYFRNLWFTHVDKWEATTGSAILLRSALCPEYLSFYLSSDTKQRNSNRAVVWILFRALVSLSVRGNKSTFFVVWELKVNRKHTEEDQEGVTMPWICSTTLWPPLPMKSCKYYRWKIM